MVEAHLIKAPLQNENYAALKVKDGVADYFRKKVGRRPSVDTRNPDVRLNLFIQRKQVSLYFDMSGESLFKRGYRLEAAAAPLRENSAAGMLVKAGWKEMARKGSFFLDPMCGSGTLAIEAALIAGDCAPGLGRERFGFDTWLGHVPPAWERVREEAMERRGVGLKELPPLFAADIDPHAVEICRANIERAGLEGCIQLCTSDFRELKRDGFPPGPGLVACNPPYGVRLEKKETVDQLYRGLGRWLHDNFSGSRAAILAPDKRTSRIIGLRADAANSFYNANLKIQLVRFTLTEENVFSDRHEVPQDTIRGVGDTVGNAAGDPAGAAREGKAERKTEEVSPADEEDDTTGVKMIVNRLKKNRRLLKKYLADESISCYRAYDADIPQYSAAIDIYEGEYAVVQEYAPPKTVDSSKAEQRLGEILQAVARFCSLPEERIFLKQRKRQKGDSQYRKLDRRDEFFIVREGGLKFFVNFTDYLDTGLFLDHRITRNYIREHAEGRRMLNLFAYTCTASVYAADGGAVRTVSVDTSVTYLEWGRKNFGLNRLDSEAHVFRRQDCMDFLETDVEQYDLIFIDPPTFSNRKGSSDVFDVQRDHTALLDRAARRLAPGGFILFSNNFRRFSLDPELDGRFIIHEITKETIPKDFERNSGIHRAWILRPIHPSRPGKVRRVTVQVKSGRT